MGLQSGSRSRSLYRAVVAVALVGAIVAAVLLVRRARDAGSRSDKATRPAAGAVAAKLGIRGPRGEIDGEAPATCWAGLDRFDADVTFASFRAWAAPLIAAGDPLVGEYLMDRLAELVGDNEKHAQEVLGWIREAAGDELWLVLEGLERSPAIHRPAIAEELAQIGLDLTLDAERRTAVLAALDTQKQLGPEILDGIAGVAMTDEPGEAGWVAARTIGRVMGEEVRRGGDAARYMDRLLAIGGGSPDAQVRSVALEMPMFSDTRIDAAGASRLAGIISSDPDLDVRQTAIHDLSLAVDRDETLRVYEEAFLAERDLCVRWALFRFSARIAGARALPVMRRMAQADPRFVDDVVVFERIYASGVVDFERVWQSLPNDDPHNCLHVEEEGEEHE